MKVSVKIFILLIIFFIYGIRLMSHSITIDGNFSDWTDADVIATDPAFDYANVMNGAWATHETPFDYVRLYATYDSTYLYVGIQIADVIDIADPANAGSSHGTPAYAMNLPQWIAIDTIDGQGYSGINHTGVGAKDFDMWHKGQRFGGVNKPDYEVYFASNFWQGPFVCPYRVNGVDGWYPDKNSVGPNTDSRLKGASGPGSQGPIIGHSPDFSSTGNKDFDYIAAGHDRSRDSFFEVAIPLDLIGNPDPNNIRLFVGQGDGDMMSGVDSIPDDTATNDYPGVESYNSPLEWEDIDTFTAPFASLTGRAPAQGYIMSGSVSSAGNIDFSAVTVYANSLTTHPAAAGTFSFSNMNTGNYLLYAALHGYVSDTQSIALNSNMSNITIQLLQLLIGDINMDKIVDGVDLMLLAHSFGQTSSSSAFNAAADLQKDGIIDGNDLMILAQNFGKTAQ